MDTAVSVVCPNERDVYRNRQDLLDAYADAQGTPTWNEWIQSQNIPDDNEKDDFVFRTLSDKSNWTEDIVTRLMEAAHIAPKQTAESCRKMAVKFIYLLRRSKSKWIPTRSCIDLTTLGAALNADEEKLPLDDVRTMWNTDAARTKQKRTVPRHFKACKYCGARFLAKRVDQEFHTPKCKLRWNRAHSAVQQPNRTAERPT
jgi:predicted Zn-ribbon and HTH transcriptional regulator